MWNRAPKKSDDVIINFLKNFNYLNKENKRKHTYRISFLWLNEELTHKIEEEAEKLIQHLQELQGKNVTLSDKINTLLALALNCFLQVSKYREECAPVQHHETRVELWGGASCLEKRMAWEKYDYKTPFSTGKFEKNLLAALNEIRESLDQDQQIKCDALIEKIKNSSPEEVRFNYDSYVP